MKSIMNRVDPDAAFKYFISVMLVVVTITLSDALSGAMHDRSPYLLSIAAVAISAWYGGSRPALLVAVLSVILVNLILIEPRYEFTFDLPKIANALMFLFVVMLVVWTEEHRRRASLALREARDELAIILNGMTDGLTVQTEDGQPIFANQAAAKLTGYRTAEELIADDAEGRARRFSLLDENDMPVPTIARPRSQVFRTGAASAMTFKLRINATGEQRWIHLKSSPVFNDRRRAKTSVNILQDITLTKTREMEIQRFNQETEAHRRRLDRLITHVPGMVYDGVLDPTTGVQRLEFVSPYAENIFGYPLESYRDDPKIWENIVHPDDHEMLEKDILAQLKNGDTARVTFRAVRQDETVIHCEAQFTLTRDDVGNPVGTAGVVSNISERVKYEETLKEQAEELRRSNEELEQFAYVASHDLQEPLRMVASYLQLIEQRYTSQLDADATEFIGYAVDGAQRMKVLINDLLMYSRVQRMKLPFAPVEMEKVLSQAKYNLQLTIEDSGALVTHDPLPELVANESQMVQLMQNLIGNALKFKGESPPKIHISIQREGKDWIFAVRDNGIGIKADYLERIFVIFQRLHGRESYSGTGIGLAVCKKIVERHGGRIWVESIPGEGSSFYFSLPVNIRKVTDGSR